MLSREYPNYAKNSTNAYEAFSKTLNNNKSLCWFFLLLTICCVIGTYYASYIYLTLSLETAEPNIMARDAAKILAVAVMCASALLFIIRPFIKGRWFTILTVAIVSYEILTMGTNQYVAFKDSSRPQLNNTAQIKNIENEISQLEKDADSLRINGENEGQSKYLVSRERGGKLLSQASEKSRLASKKRDELGLLIANQKTTFGTVIPDWVLEIKCALRSFILPGIIALCFYMLGIFLYTLSKKVGIIPNEIKPDGSDPKGKKSNSTKDELNLPKFEVQAEAQPSPVKAEASTQTIDAGTVPLEVQTAPSVPIRVQKNYLTPLDNKGDARIEYRKKIGRGSTRKRAKGTADTDVKKGKNLRYRMIVAKVKKGEVAPTRRAIKAAAKCAQSTAETYLEAMHKEGILIQNENGSYKLAPKKFTPKIVKSA